MIGKKRIVRARAFIDWDSARRLKRPSWGFVQNPEVSLRDRTLYIQDSFLEVQNRTIAALSTIHAGIKITVINSKVYHGWHRGREPSHDRRAWEAARGKLQPVIVNDISFLPDIDYGNNLECGGERVPIWDTLRRRSDDSDEQKMVDTALVSDLLSYCRSESRNFRHGEKPDVMALVIGDDDDLLPGVFTAEMWGLPIAVLRASREGESKSLSTDGLVHKL